MNTIDIKSVAIFLPAVAGVAMGVNYAMNGRVLQTVSASTWMAFWASGGFLSAILLHFLSPIKINLSGLLTWPTLGFALVSLTASIIAWLCCLFAIKNINATYAAIGEVSYPFFTALFVFLFFRARELDLPMAIGGLLIIIGSVIIITDKIKIGG